MELFGSLSPQHWLMIPAFLFVLTVVVFFHELGHFLVARWCGVGVSAFSIGFGSEVLGFTDSKGTRWKLCWIPLGGYVKFIDDENVASAPSRESLDHLTPDERARSFQGKNVAQRAAVVAAGPLANFLLAIAIFFVIFTFIGERIAAPKVDGVLPGTPAEAAGFKPGDVVLRIDGQPIQSFNEMQRIVAFHNGPPLSFVVRREGREVQLSASPERHEETDRFGNTYRQGRLGVSGSRTPEDWTWKRHDPVTSAGMAVKETYFVVERTLSYVYEVIAGRESADQLGGPIRIAQVSGQVATAGFFALLNLVAVLSVSIGLINLFPVPVLDGGHLMFYAIEAARGKPLSERWQEIGFRVGFALILMLMIFATWNDVVHLQFF